MAKKTELKERKTRKNKPAEVLSPQAKDAEALKAGIVDHLKNKTDKAPSAYDDLLPHKTQSGLLARYPDGEFREPTEEDLVQMGRAMVRRLFPQPDATIQKVETRPKPIISGAHCRICKFFDGDDDRGPLYAAKGECTLFPQPDKVMPDDLCKQKKGNGIAFEVNESLRDCNN